MTHKVPLGYTENNLKYIYQWGNGLFCVTYNNTNIKCGLPRLTVVFVQHSEKLSYLHKLTYTHILCALKKITTDILQKDCF